LFGIDAATLKLSLTPRSQAAAHQWTACRCHGDDCSSQPLGSRRI